MILSVLSLQLQDNSKDSKEQVDKSGEVKDEKAEALLADDSVKEEEH